MRRPVLLTVLVAFALLGTSSASASNRAYRASASKCPPSRAPGVLLADAQAEVFTPGPAGSDEGYFALGCAFGRKRSYALGPYYTECLASSGGSGCSDNLRNLTLGGPIVAYEDLKSIPAAGESYTVVVRDLRNGRVLHEVASSRPGNGPTTGIVVKSDGSVAWIVETRPTTIPPAEYEVRSLDKTGVHVLASGPDIGRSSLALAGSTLYWTEGGKPFSVTLR